MFDTPQMQHLEPNRAKDKPHACAVNPHSFTYGVSSRKVHDDAAVLFCIARI
jgi:hypothetical protein